LASSLPRARQTAQIIAPALGLGAPTLDDDLHELRPGDEADGLSLDEFKRRFGWVDQIDFPLRSFAPGGESWARFVLRVAERWSGSRAARRQDHRGGHARGRD
jgi:probable phosphoglycerate mutase